MRSTANGWSQALFVFESCPSHDMARPFPYLDLFFRGRASIRRVGPMPSFLRVDNESLQHTHPFSGLQTRICDTLPLSDLGCRFYPGCQTGTLRSSRPFLRFWVDNLSGCNKTILSSPVSGSGSIFLIRVATKRVCNPLYLSPGRCLLFYRGCQKRICDPLSTCLRVEILFLPGLQQREFAILSTLGSIFYPGCEQGNSQSSHPFSGLGRRD